MTFKQMRVADKIGMILIFGGLLPAIFPIIGIYIPNIVLSNACFFAWMTWEIIINGGKKELFKLKNNYPVLVMLLMYFLSLLMGNDILGNRYMNLSVVYFGGVIFTYYKDKNSLFVIKYVLIMLTPFLGFTTMKTLAALLSNPYISRSIKSGLESAEILRQGISGYSLIYMLAALAPILLFLFLQSEKIVYKFISILIYVLCFITVVVSNYFTALICVIVSSILLIVLYCILKKNFLQLILFALVSLFILVFWSSIIESVISLISSLSPDGKTAMRLNEMSGDLFGGLSEEMSGDRWPTMKHSIEMFLQNPLFGVLLKDNSGGNILTGIGQHSHILDTFAIWGGPLGIINTIIIFRVFKRECFVGRGIMLTLPVVVCLLIIWGFNNCTNSVAVVVYLLYPYIYNSYFSQRR